jgi:proteasome lid subunit RPN8/RPN11
LLDRIAKQAASSPHRETCGLLLGRADEIVDAVAVPNAAADPATGFVLDPATHVMTSRQARARGLRLIGHYHSHPGGNPEPSRADAAKCNGDDAYWMIVTAKEQSLWLSRSGGVTAGAFDPVELTVVQAPACKGRMQAPRKRGE